MLQISATIFLLSVAGAALAADATVQRKIFDRVDAPVGSETVLGSAELPPGASLGFHTHNGVEFGYVAEGEVEFLVRGRDSYRVKAGGFYKIEAGAIHDAHSVGGPAKVVATWVVEKGKPLATPAK